MFFKIEKDVRAGRKRYLLGSTFSFKLKYLLIKTPPKASTLRGCNILHGSTLYTDAHVRIVHFLHQNQASQILHRKYQC